MRRACAAIFWIAPASAALALLKKLTTALRAFLRYLSARGQCQADLDQVVPTFASWRLARLPRYLTAEQVASLITACDGGSPGRRRDRAMILLLARLGLRAGDVAGLRIGDIEWETGTLRVSGKGRYQVRLPLPQDAGDAILDYLVMPDSHPGMRPHLRSEHCAVPAFSKR